jgi:CDP-6-deoxy-D-xylo-4-hexulose-3-dehydrase
MQNYIPLVKNTIDQNDLNELSEWIKQNPILTKSKLTIELEQKWSEWLGTKYSVFVNSGSSANLAIFYGLIVSNKLKNKKIVFSCLSWVTTISPAIQLGLKPILCDIDRETLGIDVDKFEKICKKEKPAALMIVHALAFPNDMKRLIEICKKYDVILLEDSCESVGSTVENKKTGTFGFASSFSTYYGHHFSTIEGGFISTNDFDFYNILKSIRSHGWSRDLDENTKKNLQIKYNIDDFRNLYTFYYPGFNLRSTDLQAFIGIKQLNKLDGFCQKRYENLKIYDKYIKNNYWKININRFEFVSNFAYPIIHPEASSITKKLKEANIECRPLIAGSISRQPFFIDLYGKKKFDSADVVHDYGLYVPNNPDMSEKEIEYICENVNHITTEFQSCESTK